MCVWSAYTGKKSAAPFLIDSLGRIEGIWGGFYTGLVTNDNGVLRMGKVLGNLRVWKEKYSAKDFPGFSGLIHSRTNSGGDERWGHPFVGSSGKVAIISQGCGGLFAGESNPKFEKWGNEMLEKGKIFSSGIFDLPKRYPVLSDGGQVHSAEVAVQAVEYYYEKLNDPFEAVKLVQQVLTNEAASLFLFADHPGVIAFSNSNQHLVYQQDDDRTFLSITTLGLPSKNGMELPCNSVGIVTPDSLRIEKLHPRYETDMTMPEKMLSLSLECIKANPGLLLGNVTDRVLKPLLPQDKLCYRAGAAYRVLEQLVNERLVRMEPVECNSSQGTPGTVFKLYAV